MSELIKCTSLLLLSILYSITPSGIDSLLNILSILLISLRKLYFSTALSIVCAEYITFFIFTLSTKLFNTTVLLPNPSGVINIF